MWLKIPNTTSTPAQHGGRRGRGGCFLCSPEDLRHKNLSCDCIITESTLKITFLLQVCVHIFCNAFFLLLLDFCLRNTGLIFVLNVELWHSIPRVAFLAFTKTNKNLKEKLG
jgi:hypothetical protein